MFQFTHPGKGATLVYNVVGSSCLFQFTHPGKGATRHFCSLSLPDLFQFTHPGKGATPNPAIAGAVARSFNSRTLGRVRRQALFHPFGWRPVSIHAPWEGCDSTLADTYSSRGCFNSRTLGRVRLFPEAVRPTPVLFQFTHPGKGATSGISSNS